MGGSDVQYAWFYLCIAHWVSIVAPLHSNFACETLDLWPGFLIIDNWYL